MLKKLRNHDAVRHLGPGLITGAADDDPSGIATYSQAGAQFGFNMLWTMVFTYPLMVGIQMVSARIGHLTGKGPGTYPPIRGGVTECKIFSPIRCTGGAGCTMPLWAC